MKHDLIKAAFSFLARTAGRAAHAGLEFLLPPLCLNCERLVTRNQTLCADCWKALHFVAPPLCATCGAPFDLPVEEGTLCGACLDHPPAYDKARSALIYDDASREMILRLKHGDRLHPAPTLAKWMAQAGDAGFWQNVDVLAPVPLHRWRLLLRRYNQAAVLALAIGKQLGKPVVVDALRRVRATESQGHKNRKERQANVAGAFAVRREEQVRGKVVVLVDDVLTSGATVEACAKALLKAGAAQVRVVTLARTRIAS